MPIFLLAQVGYDNSDVSTATSLPCWWVGIEYLRSENTYDNVN